MSNESSSRASQVLIVLWPHKKDSSTKKLQRCQMFVLPLRASCSNPRGTYDHFHQESGSSWLRMPEGKTCRRLLMDFQTCINRFVPRIFVSPLTYPLFGVSLFVPHTVYCWAPQFFLKRCPALSRWWGSALWMSPSHLSPMAVSGPPDVSLHLCGWWCPALCLYLHPFICLPICLVACRSTDVSLPLSPFSYFLSFVSSLAVGARLS